MLDIKSEVSGKTTFLRCAGRIVRGDETALLCAASGHAGRAIVLDLGQVEAIDAAGIGALISLQAAGLYLQLMNVPRTIDEILRLTGLDSVFEVLSPAPAFHHEKSRKSAVPFLSPVTAAN